MLLYFILSYYFDCAFDICLPLQGYSDLAKAAFTQHFPDFIPLFDVMHWLEPSIVFKINYCFLFLQRERCFLFAKIHILTLTKVQIYRSRGIYLFYLVKFLLDKQVFSRSINFYFQFMYNCRRATATHLENITHSFL